MKILILGATGAAGGSLLDMALSSAMVSEIRTISRRPIETETPGHIGFVHQDMRGYTDVSDAFTGVDACFFCIGRSVSQVRDEAEYRTMAMDFAEAAARELRTRSPEAIFHYLSGQGTSLASRHMWARVKAEAETHLLKEYRAVCWRPGAIDARQTAGWPAFYRFVTPVLRYLAPSRRFYVKGEDLARAMLQIASKRVHGRIFENREIRQIADEYRTHEQRQSV